MTNRTGTQGGQVASGGGDELPRPGGGPFAALGRIVTGHPWLVIAVWIIAAVGIVATAPALPTTTNEASFLPSHYESIRAQNLQNAGVPAGRGTIDSPRPRSSCSPAPTAGALTAADKAKVASDREPR